jgi:hypothetical protein
MVLVLVAAALAFSGCGSTKTPAGSTSASGTTTPTGSTTASGSTSASGSTGNAAVGNSADCPLSDQGSSIGMTLPTSCTVVASDTASSPSIDFWNRPNEDLDCDLNNASPDLSGVRWPSPVKTGSDGDPHPTALGSPQPSPDSYRQVTVVDGDNVYGERCELGFDWTERQDAGRGPGPGPTVFYREGDRRVTYMSIRLGNGVDPSGSDWRVVMQMKQTEPYDIQSGGPVLDMEVRDGEWVLVHSWHDLWAAPAQQYTWTRFAFDVTYSRDPRLGRVRVYVDLNGDGDFGDANEVSPAFHVATLRAEQARLPGGTYSDVPSPYGVGKSIPDHLRAGIYEDPDYPCPSGCSVDIDNVQVVKP